MIVYNVTAKVQTDAATAWAIWMEEEHIPELMQTGLFSGYRLCRLLDQDETDDITYTVQYYFNTMEDYETYIRDHAPSMREKGLRRFGSKFIAFRTVMKTILSS